MTARGSSGNGKSGSPKRRLGTVPVKKKTGAVGKTSRVVGGSTPSPNRLSVSRGGGLVVIRVAGMGNMIIAPGLQDFVEEERATGYRRFVFDLAECRGMDSTFMGCMVGLYTALKKESGRFPIVSDVTEEEPMPTAEELAAEVADGDDAEPLSPEEALDALRKSLAKDRDARLGPDPLDDGFVIAINVSIECRELLNILGVDKFVKVRGNVDLAQLEMTDLPNLEMDPEKRRDLILRAHENLVEIDKRNEAKFGAFLRSLSDELARDRKEEE